MADVFIQSGTLAVGETPAPYLQGLYIPAIDSSGFTDGYKIVIPWGGGSTARAFPLDELLESAPDGMDTFLTALSGQLMSQAPAQTVYNFEGLVGLMGVPGPIGPQGIVIAAAPGPTSDWIVYDVSKPIFSSSIVFSDDYPSGDTDAVSWIAGSVKRGTSTYNVVAGNSDKEFIYWDQSDPYVFNGSDTRTDAVGVYKWFMGHNVNGTFYPVYGAKLYEGELLRDATIKANAVATGAIEEAKIAADAVTALKINVAGLDGTTGYIKVSDATAANIVTDGINTSATTYIAPGKILISGAVNLDDWRAAGDTTYIDGGKLYADSVTAAKINVVGLNGSTGRIVVADATDANVVTGAINTYATTEISAGKIVISGATNLDDWAKTGDTTKIDGGKISTNTVTATQIAANTITAAQIYAGTITANEIAGTTITAGLIHADAIETDKIKIGNVTTSKLEDSATKIQTVGTDASQYVSASTPSYNDVLTVSHVSLGGTIVGVCQGDVNDVTTSTSIRVYNSTNSVVLWEETFVPADGYFSFSFMAVTGVGTKSIKMQAQEAGGDYTLLNGYLSLTEDKGK